MMYPLTPNRNERPMKNVLRIGLVAAALALTSACTPEEAAKVIDDYAAQMRTQAADAAAGPTMTVTATCETIAVHADGFAEGSMIFVGIESEPPLAIRPVDGVADWSVPIWQGWHGYSWMVDGLDDGSEAQTGRVDC